MSRPVSGSLDALPVFLKLALITDQAAMATVRASDEYPLELLSVKREEFSEVSGSASGDLAQPISRTPARADFRIFATRH